MKFCRECGTQLPDEAAFCTNCGKVIEQTTVVNAQRTVDDEEGTTVLGDEKDPYATTVLDEIQYPDGRDAGIQNETVPSGARQSETRIGNISDPGNNQNRQMTYEEFYEKVASDKTKSNAKTLIIICAITAVADLIFGVVMSSGLYFIDVVFYAVLTVLMIKKKNWVFPLITTCYSGAFTVLGMVSGGQPVGVVALVISIMTTIKMKKMKDAYAEYQKTGQLRSEQI